MNKIYTLLFLAVTMMGYSQQGELHYEGQPVGSTFAIDSATASVSHPFIADFYMVNKGAVDLNITMTRYQKHTTFGWTDFLCDCDLCPPASETVWESPSYPVIAPGDSCIFQPKVYSNGINGCAIYNYVIEAQNHTFIDSIEITFTIAGINCFLGEEEIETPLAYSVYPNPAKEILNIDIQNTTNNTSIVVFDIVGKKVAEKNLANGNNKLNIESLKSGVYFYSLIRDENILETKKLIVR